MAGLASAVPASLSTLDDDAKVFGEADAKRVFKNTGVARRHVTRNGMTAADLAVPPAEALLEKLGWARDSVDALIFVTQSPDYFSPATACVVHARLGLAPSCAALDVNLGCSGWVYGVWLASSLISSGAARRALVLVGDVVSQTLSPRDRSVAPLFGDAGAATALERDDAAAPMEFVVGTDGSGANHLMVPAGGFRLRATDANGTPHEAADGNVRSLQNIHMNGAEVFTFTLKAVPPLIKEVMARAQFTHADTDAYVFHQASSFMLKSLSRSCQIPADKFVMAIEDYGNTSMVSVPLAMCEKLRGPLAEKPMRLVLAGFGVGWSWGALAFTSSPMVVLPVQVLEDKAGPALVSST
jgi:3-oxoacyl-[acyl-carrier-protein] synthase-3